MEQNVQNIKGKALTREFGLKKIEKNVAKLFIIFLPFRMFVPFKNVFSMFGPLSGRTSFLFLCLGIVLMIINTKGVLSLKKDVYGVLFKLLCFMYAFVNITSLIMAMLLYNELGTIGGENALIGIIPNMLYTVSYIITIYYVRRVFQLLNRNEVSNLLEYIVNMSILVGFFQILILYTGTAFVNLHKIIDNPFDSWSGSLIVQTGRIGLFGIEPAVAGNLITILLIPYLIGKGIYEGFSTKVNLKLFLLAVVLYFTKSTTGYSLLIVDFILAIILYIKTREASKKVVLFFSLLLGGFIFLKVIMTVNLSQFSFFKTIDESFVNKLLNKNNSNVTSRLVI